MSIARLGLLIGVIGGWAFGCDSPRPSVLPVADKPIELLVSPDGQTAYIAHYTLPGRLTVVSLGPPPKVVAQRAVGNLSKPMLLSHGGRRLWLAQIADNSVSVFDTATLTTLATIDVGIGPVLLRAHPARPEVYTVNGGSNDVTVLDGDSLAFMTTIPVGNSPADMVIDREGHRAYLSLWGADHIEVVNLDTLEPLTRVRVGSKPRPMALSADGGVLFVGNIGGRSLTVVDTRALTVRQTVKLPGAPADLVVDGDRLWALTVDQDALLVLDPPYADIASVLHAGDFPRRLAVSPDGEVWVVARNSKRLLRYDAASLSQVQAQPAGEGPLTLIVVPERFVLILDFDGNALRMYPLS